MSTSAKQKQTDILQFSGMLLAIACSLIVWLIDTPAGLSVTGQRTLALFTGVFILYLTEALALPITSLLIVPVSSLIGITSIKDALTGFASPSIYLIVGAFILATAMIKTQLAERITFLIFSYIGFTPWRITLGITASNIILAFLVPSTTARTALLLPVCLTIIDLLGSEKRSRSAARILLTLCLTNSTISAGILTATVPNPITIEAIAKTAGQVVSYTDWFIYGFPPAFGMTILTWAIIGFSYYTRVDERTKEVASVIRDKLDAMGKMSLPEWKTLFVFLLVTLLWATQGLTQLDTTLICLCGAGILFLPKFGVIDWDDASKGISWPIIFIAGGGITLGDLLMKTGAAEWLAINIFQLLGLQTVTALLVLIIVIVVVQGMHIFFVSTTAMTTAILPIILGIAQTAHINPITLALPTGMIIGGYPVLMFYNALPNIVVYGTGRLSSMDFLRVGVLISLAVCLLYSLCAPTYWNWVGLL